ncbi:MAG TPA: outer membrane lipoprotein-sorting protein [Bacillota bacterium]
MKKFTTIILGLIFVCGILSGVPIFGAESATDILRKLDYNQAPSSVIYDVQMVIHQADRVDTKTMKLYGEGQEKSYALFLSPARDKGTAVLRLNDNLWMYLPSAEKTMKISGHMLRQSFMGSDFSYSDSTERLQLLDLYDATVTGAAELDGRNVYLLELKAKQADANYFTRKLWIDQERYVALRQEMYAKSGKLLKVMTTESVLKVGDRFFAAKVKMEDKLKKNTYSEMIFTDIKLDEAIPDSIFTIQNLEKKQ